MANFIFEVGFGWSDVILDGWKIGWLVDLEGWVVCCAVLDGVEGGLWVGGRRTW